MSDMNRTDTKFWAREELADAIVARCVELCEAPDTNMDEEIELKKQRNRTLNFLGMSHKIQSNNSNKST